MEKIDIFRDIAERTGGDIYLGVVGGVRTGKSTFIKRFMETVVIPKIDNPYDQERARDELPQSGAGRTVMTTEPKFIPNEAVEIDITPNLNVKIRLVDCVGYRVEGALGYEEDDGPRMISTPWFDEDIPFQEAAEIGTRKVISEHSTIGIVVTTDGSITDIPRENYMEAEERVISELKDLNRPFIIILNSINPDEPETSQLAYELMEKYDVPALALNCAELNQSDILKILEEVLYEFPVNEVNVALPKWVEELETTHWLREKFESAVGNTVNNVRRLRDIDMALEELAELEFVRLVELENMDMGTGSATINIDAKNELFYQILSQEINLSVEGEHDVYRLMRDLSAAKKEYDKVAAALQEVYETGYGVVIPTMDDMNMEMPELIRSGGRSGVKLKASAPSIHMIRADIKTEITPVFGTEKQCSDLLSFLFEEYKENPEKLWSTEIFGKSVHALVREGIQNKLQRMPENAQEKLRETVSRIVNEGSGGLICIII
ncbi:stage IV sporulation protein A [Desulfofarcimen acetoxidans DSM 771]|jgi:stage IV sporulation protein A|uniref:Stage IV sporulation protein A n=1 Tax=Desulfofarcimen acetoxidans (strain ATCC 49208 / DSM 771 / KCTC 5769 / VKM B-1644 / 5575) TaxID=485916 RepID=C8VZ30_DESAS|nr:stage IV sporulation protein A [Desulfofarcimen acetoxidans]ACV62940.1 stage IV sporulation protein A [Desulfofarcimen acetoxidans DSM 771]